MVAWYRSTTSGASNTVGVRPGAATGAGASVLCAKSAAGAAKSNSAAINGIGKSRLRRDMSGWGWCRGKKMRRRVWS